MQGSFWFVSNSIMDTTVFLVCILDGVLEFINDDLDSLR